MKRIEIQNRHGNSLVSGIAVEQTGKINCPHLPAPLRYTGNWISRRGSTANRGGTAALPRRESLFDLMFYVHGKQLMPCRDGWRESVWTC